METSLLWGIHAAIQEALGILRSIYDGKLVDPAKINGSGKNLFILNMMLEQELDNFDSTTQAHKDNEADPVHHEGEEIVKAKKILRPSAEQERVARILLDLSGDAFTLMPKQNASYLTLDSQIGKSKQNKNAVGIMRGGRVIFKVNDWRAEEQANSLGIETMRSENPHDRRLEFPSLSPAIIESHEDFFRDLLTAAKQASVDRQS